MSAVLAEHRREQEAERAAAGDAWVETGLVYVNADGTPLNPDYVSRHFQTLCRQAGVPVIRFHDTRHVSVTLALLPGCCSRSSAPAPGTRPRGSPPTATSTPTTR